jgi:hypothetical protein
LAHILCPGASNKFWVIDIDLSFKDTSPRPTLNSGLKWMSGRQAVEQGFAPGSMPVGLPKYRAGAQQKLLHSHASLLTGPCSTFGPMTHRPFSLHPPLQGNRHDTIQSRNRHRLVRR